MSRWKYVNKQTKALLLLCILGYRKASLQLDMIVLVLHGLLYAPSNILYLIPLYLHHRQGYRDRKINDRLIFTPFLQLKLLPWVVCNIWGKKGLLIDLTVRFPPPPWSCYTFIIDRWKIWSIKIGMVDAWARKISSLLYLLRVYSFFLKAKLVYSVFFVAESICSLERLNLDSIDHLYPNFFVDKKHFFSNNNI